MKSTLKSIALASVCVLVSACATTNFYPHESRDNTYIGKGGARFVNEGIDVWFIGEPDRKYSILGYIESPLGAVVDDNHKTVSSTILKKAHEVGADALIEVVNQTQPNSTGTAWGGGGMFGGGYHGGYSGMGIGIGFPISQQSSARYTAIKYLN